MATSICFILLAAGLLTTSLAEVMESDFDETIHVTPGDESKYADMESDFDETIHVTPGDESKYVDDVTTQPLSFEPKYARMLDATQLENLKSSPSVSTVHYMKSNQRRLSAFFLEFDKSAGFLKAYGLTVGLVNCIKPVKDEQLQKVCGEADADKIYTYRNGLPVLELELETMFDVNSIMSNILQLALLEDVQIVQTTKNRLHLEHESSGVTDIVYGYHNAIGTYEHRVFMEIAYAYRDKYKFVVSTEHLSATGLQDAESVADATCAMWVLYCRERYNAASGCRSVNYRGEFNLLDLATYFKQLNWPKVLHRSDAVKEMHPCELNGDTPCIYIYHSAATKPQVESVVDSIQFDVHGMAGLIVQQKEVQGQDPQLVIKKSEHDRDGISLDQPWSLENIEIFITTHVFSDSEVDAYEKDALQPEEIDNSEPAAIDDMVIQVAFDQRKTIGKAPAIPALTDKTFPTTVKDKKLLFVLFYIPFDSVGMLFLGPYQNAGKDLANLKGDDPSAHPLARVNCFDWTDVCAKENITTYPVIHIYRDGGKNRQQYHHAFDKDVVVRSAWLLEAEQPLMLNTAEEVESFVDGRLPKNTYQLTDNIVLLNPSKSKSGDTEVIAFKKAAKTLETQMLFAIVGPGIKTEVVPEGAVLHVRLTDKDQPSDVLTEISDAESIENFLLRGQFNLLPELTHLNFPVLYARQQPFGILFYRATSEDAPTHLTAMVNTIRTNKAPGIIFCKMTIGRENPVAEAILTNYTQSDSLVLPSFAIVNHQKGEVHVLEGQMFSEEQLLTWVKDVQDGSVTPTKVLEKGEWKPPGHHYDFLAIMDRERRLKKNKNSMEKEFTDLEDSADEQGQKQDLETEEQDSDIRSNLLELQHSRLYSSKERKLHMHSSTADERLPQPASSAQKGSSINMAATEKGGKGTMQHTEL